MPNLSINSIATATSVATVLADVTRAIGHPVTDCVGVMIQAGKTLTDPKKVWKTTLGGHVSPFVIENGILLSWDEIGGQRPWQAGAENSICNMHNTVVDDQAGHNGIMQVSTANDVTLYFHEATPAEVAAVSVRAGKMVNDQVAPQYKHGLNFGYEQPSDGDCVSKSAWVMAAFSYSKPVQGGITPWAQAAIYELYSNPFNFMSGWYKIKYKGRKLNVM